MNIAQAIVAIIMCGDKCSTRASACIGPLEMATHPGYSLTANATWRVPLCSSTNLCGNGLECMAYSDSDLVQVRDVTNSKPRTKNSSVWFMSGHWTRERRVIKLSAVCADDSFKLGLLPTRDLPKTTELSVCHHVVNRLPPRPISRHLYGKVGIMICLVSKIYVKVIVQQ